MPILINAHITKTLVVMGGTLVVIGGTLGMPNFKPEKNLIFFFQDKNMAYPEMLSLVSLSD